jgi:hypothetical protein
MGESDALNYLTVLVSLVALVLLASRRLRQSFQWRATVTPLASIIGSGFLIVAPLLHSVLGKWALAGMILLSALAYAIGAIIRFNIRYAEDYLADNHGDKINILETLSQWVLGIAYAISVAFYTSLFTAFLFDRIGIVDPNFMRWATTALLLFVMTVAWRRGTHGLETIELIAVTLKLAIIIGVLVALASYDVMTGIPWFQHEAIRPLTLWDTAAMLAGMLMVTQGFETARFIGANYSAAVRINAVRYSQWIATVIYVVFIGVTCPLFLAFPILELNETTISQTLGQVVMILPVLLLIAATASQLSAALADTIGGGGLLKELVPIRLPDNIFYMGIVAIAIILIWSANVFEIINYASKGFGAYYLFQVLITIALLKKQNIQRNKIVVLSGCYLLVAILLFVVFASIAAPHT